MKKSILTAGLSFLIVLGFASCSSETENESDESENGSEVVEQTDQDEPEEMESVEEESPLGNFSALVGEWTVDAATAGVRMDLTFEEDGAFTQKMGTVNGIGTWEVVNDERVKIVTQNTKGQTWKISEITEEGMNICWNPDKANPKTIPMKRVK